MAEMYDLTHLIRENITFPSNFPYKDITKEGVYIFNASGLLTDYGLLVAYRAFAVKNTYDRAISELKIPTQWYPLDHPKAVPFNWWTGEEFVGIMLIRNGNVVAQTILFDKEFKHKFSDPRLYYKADGSVYLYAITYKNDCGIFKWCNYLLETQLFVSSNIIKRVGEWNVICLNELENIAKEKAGSASQFIEKNWSPWYRGFSNFITYSLPRHKIYQEVINSNCKLVYDKIQEPISKMEKAYKLDVNGKTVNMFKIWLTTPAISVRINGRNLRMGAGHVRCPVPYFHYHADLEKRREVVQGLDPVLAQLTAPFYTSLRNMLLKLRELYLEDKLFSHPDLYLICLYTFDPETAEIIYWSDAFIPMIYSQGSFQTRIPLAFPMSLIEMDHTIYVFYGEGDTQCRFVALSENVLETILHPFSTNLKEFPNYRLLRCTDKDGYCTDERTVSEILDEQFM